MITLILNYFNETYTLTSTLCCGIALPIIYFSNPLQSTLTQDLKQLSEDNYKYDPNQGMLFNISKGIEAYEAWVAEDSNWFCLQKEQDPSTYNSYLSKDHLDDLALNYQDDLALDQLWENLNEQNNKNYKDFLSNKEEYRAGSLFDKLGRAHVIASYSSDKKRIRPTRLSRAKSRKGSRFSLFNRYNS
jgi:hypothetical protein